MGSGEEADTAGLGGGDVFRTEVQETTLKLSQEGAAQAGLVQQVGRPACGIQPHHYQHSAGGINPEAKLPGGPGYHAKAQQTVENLCARLEL